MKVWPAFDDLIGMSVADHQRPTIWSTMDRDETSALVSRFIQTAQVSPAAAQAVRGMVHVWNNYQWAIVIWPRFVETFLWYAQHGGMVAPTFLPAVSRTSPGTVPPNGYTVPPTPETVEAMPTWQPPT